MFGPRLYARPWQSQEAALLSGSTGGPDICLRGFKLESKGTEVAREVVLVLLILTHSGYVPLQALGLLVSVFNKMQLFLK